MRCARRVEALYIAIEDRRLVYPACAAKEIAILSKASEYTVLAMVHLAASSSDDYTPVGRLAKPTGVPHSFLSKLCHTLTQAGILQSRKGPRGGVAFARPTDKITLLHIVEAIEGVGLLEKCALGLARCDPDQPCPVHDRWVSVKEEIHAMLSQESIQDLANDVAEGKAILPKV